MIRKLFKALRIAEEGTRVILTACAGCAVLSFLFPVLSFLFLFLFLFFLFFFRDPARDVPQDTTAVLSPADGRIRDIDVVTLPGFEDHPFCRIGIFLSLLNVHVQRFPCSGEIEKSEYRKGRFHPAFRKIASGENESNLTVMKTGYGPIAVRQIAGSVARRVVCNAPAGRRVAGGEKMGIIMFGSRVELYIPADIELLVKKGDRVVAGETIIGAGKPE